MSATRSLRHHRHASSPPPSRIAPQERGATHAGSFLFFFQTREPTFFVSKGGFSLLLSRPFHGETFARAGSACHRGASRVHVAGAALEHEAVAHSLERRSRVEDARHSARDLKTSRRKKGACFVLECGGALSTRFAETALACASSLSLSLSRERHFPTPPHQPPALFPFLFLSRALGCTVRSRERYRERESDMGNGQELAALFAREQNLVAPPPVAAAPSSTTDDDPRQTTALDNQSDAVSSGCERILSRGQMEAVFGERVFFSSQCFLKSAAVLRRPSSLRRAARRAR